MFPIFSFLNLVIDQSQKICVYNNKEKTKICKILLKNEDVNFKISNITKLLMDTSQEYLVFITEKDKSERINYTVLDLIKSQLSKDKKVMEEYTHSEPFNFNLSSLKDSAIESKKSYISILKIKDLILKCYPQYALIVKKGLSLKKIMMKFDSNNLPFGDEIKSGMLGKMIISNLSLALSKPKKENKSKTKKKTPLKSVNEKNEDDPKNITGNKFNNM